MRPTDDLRTEHRAVERMLGVLDAMAESARSGACPTQAELAETTEFLHVFVDQCHHGKEEQILFPAMQSAGLDDAAPAVRILLDEHVTGRARAARLFEAAGAVAKEGKPACPSLLAAIPAYNEFMRAHIAFEERDAFDAADAGLPAADAERVVAEYERLERDVIGEGKHEQFHEMLDRLERTFSVPAQS